MEITDEQQFEQAVEQGNVVVEFYANWCPDCRRIESKMPEWKGKYADQFTLLRLNRDEVPAVADRLEVMGIPSFLVFQEGELQTRLFSRDAKSVKQVENFLDQLYK